MANWTQIENNASFNIIRDGKPVDAKTVNHVMDHVEGNLQWLYDEVADLKSDKGAVIVYGAPTAGGREFDDHMRPGTPVYWVKDTGATGGGYWSPAVIDLREPETDEREDYYWVYDDSSLAQGIIVRRDTEDSTVDVCLSGKIVFDIEEDGGSYYVVAPDDTGITNGNQLENLFNYHGGSGNRQLSSAFFANPDPTADDVVEPSNFRNGTFYLSELSGKLVPNSKYTRTLAVMIVDVVGGEYKLNTLVCPEGFGGEKFHTHKKVTLKNRFGYTGAMQYGAIPDSWYPDTSHAGKRLINTAMAEIETGSEVFPYSELVGATGSTTESEMAQVLYSTSGTGRAGWLSAKDDYFTELASNDDFIIPVSDETGGVAIWGFTVNRVDSLAPITGVNWNAPVDYDHMILTLNGQPIPRSYYTINASGIWWLASGVEHAPMYELFEPTLETSRELELWFIDPLGESQGAAITEINSRDLIPTKDSGGQATIDTKDAYLSQTLVPVLPFNPMDDIERASEAEVEEGTNNKIITPATAKHAIDYFVALTQLDEQRSCKEYQGDWGDLKISGFYQVIGATDGPKDSEETAPLGLVGAIDTQIFQFELGEFASFVRVGKGTVGATSWGAWLLITEKPYDPLYLPRNDTANDLTTETTLSLIDHRERTIVSLDESTNKVIVPELTGDGAEDGMNLRFVNEMSSGSEASTLVVELGNQVSGYDGKFLVCPGQSCAAARHHMGQGLYAAGDAGSVVGVPEYLDVQVTARLGGTITVDDTSSLDGELRYVKFECEAPQYYGNNSIEIEVINGTWSVVGGSGIWFILDTAGYEDLVTGDSIENALHSLLVDRVDTADNIKVQDNSKTALKFTTRQVRVSVIGYTLPAWGTQDFSSSGGIT